MALILKDQDSRDIISRELDLNLLVEAGAGSGKTEEMSKRILALINSGYRSIGEIVAITFTRKAANELRERIRTTLEKEHSKSGNTLQKAALDHIHECFIGTIHSFCAKMLRERPIEAGVDPGFEEIDDAKDEMIRQRTWETFVMDADDDDKSILNLMEDFGVNDGSAKLLLKEVCENQDVNFDVPHANDDTPHAIFTRIIEVLKTLYSMVRDNYNYIPADVLRGMARSDGLQNSLMKFRNKTKGTKSANLSKRELIDILMIFSTASSVKVTQKCWGESKYEKERAKELSEEFTAFRDSYIVPIVNTVNATVYDHLLVPFALKAKDVYMQHKRTVAQLNFQDLLMMTSRLLRDYPEVRSYFQNKYKTLLIDEFQDTDPIQAEIAMYLTGIDLNEKVWHKLTPRKGSLFVVGDPKQSIYGFRRADFKLYKRFREHIIKTGGKVVELRTNFRSTDDLGVWFDSGFPKLLDGEDQALFTEMDTLLPALEGTLSGVAYYWIDEKINGAVLAAESKALPRIISHLVNNEKITQRTKNDTGDFVLVEKQVKYKDILVLARKKKQLEIIANAVAISGIPVRITGADITKRTSEFVSFGELIKMLAFPEENAYVYNVMRGEFFRISNHYIYWFKRSGGDFSIYFNFDEFYDKHELGENLKIVFDTIKNCFDKLRRFSDYIQNLSPAAATERIIEDLGIMKIHLTSNEKLAGFGSFVSLIEKIRLKKITDIWGLNLFLEEISSMIVNGFEEDIDIEGKDVNAVRFMNVHKAKGLEAPVVILCAPCSGTLPDPSFYTELVVNDDGTDQVYGYKRISKYPNLPYSKNFYEPLGWRSIENEARKSEELERDRLLYVAATRAKNYLIIGDSAAKSNPWEKLVDMLPIDKTNVLETVYRTDIQNTTSQSDIERRGVADIDKIDDELVELRTKRENAFNENTATYRMYAPSHEASKTKDGSTDSSTEDIEKQITLNSMEVIIYGEETSIREDKLSIGNIVHKVLDTLISDESALPETISLILEDNAENYITEDFLETIAKEFKKRDLWERIQKSDAVYTEVPFSFKAYADTELSGELLGEDTYVRGFIDLVFKDENGWVIVDYKTHDEKELAHDIRAEHEKQLESYKEIWEKITGEPVIETTIFYIRKKIIYM